MRPLARRRSCKRSKLLCCGGSRVGCSTFDDNYKRFTRAIITIIFCPLLAAFAQELTPTPTPQTAGEPVATTFEVIVTGSNIPTAEEVGPNPVDTYSRGDIFRLGVHSATDFVQKLPVVNGPSINDNTNTIGDGRTEIDLRGLFSKETLVLQDGRRLATDGFAGYDSGNNFFFTPTVDLNLFPLGLIDRIDILKDGASAIYGSDAVAGVVNVWLIHKFRGLEVYTSYGNTNLGSSNDQGEELAYLLAGTGDDKTNIVVYAEVYNRAAIFNRDRDISSNVDATPFGGSDNRSPDFAGHVGDFVYQPSLNGGARSPTPHSFPNVASDPQYASLSGLPRAQQGFNFAALTPAMAPVDREYLYGSLDHKICSQYLELFADFKYVRTFWDGAQAPTPFASDVFTDSNHPLGISGLDNGISVPIQNPFNPFTVADYTSPGGADPKVPGSQVSAVPPGTQLTTGVRYRALEAGLRTDKVTTHNYEFTGGLKGNLGEFGDYFKTWNWESGFRYSEDSRVERRGGIANSNALRAALLDTNPATAFNPFGLNQNSPSVIDRIFDTTQRVGTASLTLEDLKLYGDLWNLPAGPISFAIGGEHRAEHENDQPDALTASRQIIGAEKLQNQQQNPVPDFLPTRGSRDVWSIYWEVRVPVTSALWNCPGFHSLELGYQERYDNFSDFSATERPKFFFRWQPIDSSLTLRGTFNEAYHAPALAEMYTLQAQRLTLLEDPAIVLPGDPLGRTPGTPLTPLDPGVKETIGGNPHLNAEVAYEWTYGAVWTPAKLIRGLTLTADFYHIDLRNTTDDLDPSFVVDLNFDSRKATLPNGAPEGGAFSGFIQRDPITGAILNVNANPQNVSRVITEGLDYEAVYQLDSSTFGRSNFGTLTFTFNGNYLARFVHQPPGGHRVNFNGAIFGTRFGSYPRDHWYASVFYDGPSGSWLAGLDAGAVVHYVAQYSDGEVASDVNGRKIREWTTLDLILNYTFNLPASAAQNEVPGYARDGGKNTKTNDDSNKSVMPVSTAEYNPCGWRAWLNNTTITLGVNNVFDQDPPFAAGASNFENNYDERQANIRGRVWYVALTKRF